MTDVTLQDVQSIYIWNHQVNKVYLGDRQIRPEGTPPIPVFPTNWLLGYRPLQSDLLDASGNWYDGSWYDNSWTKSFVTVWWKTGAYVYRATGSDFSAQHVVSWLSYGWSNGGITICWWVLYDLYTTWGSRPWPATNVRVVGGRQSDWISLSSRPSTWYNFAWWYESSSTVVFNWDTVPTLLSWYFVCLTIGDGIMRIYVDGNLENEMYISDSTINIGDIWRFWCCHTWWYDFGWMNGYVRDWAVYERALTPQEVSDFYTVTQ